MKLNVVMAEQDAVSMSKGMHVNSGVTHTEEAGHMNQYNMN